MSRLEELIKELCPNGVCYYYIEDIAKITRGRVISKQYIIENEGEYPVYSSQTENNGELGFISTYDFDGEYLTWTTDGANAGSVFYRNGKFSITNVCGLIEIVDSFVMIRFLYYILSVEAKKYVNRGMGNPKLMSNVMAKVKVPVPPLEVQREIVRILDYFTELTTKLTTELITELTARKKQYEYYASTLISNSNYEWVYMSELAKFVYGYTDKARDYGDARFIRITDIDEQGCLNRENVKYITLNDEARKSLLSKGDLIMARTGATYGKTLFFDSAEPSVYASFLIKIIPDSKRLNNKYYWHFTKTSLYWNQANKLVSTGGQPQFNTPALKKIKIPLPSLEEQQRIVDILDRFDTLCNDLTAGLPAEIEARRKQYEYYRDKLLTFEPLAD